MRHPSRLHAAVITTAALILLAGCAAAGPSPVPSPTATRVASALPTAAPTVVASNVPSPSPSADVGGCVNASVDFAPDARGLKGDPIDLAKAALTGLRATDILTRDAGPDASSAQIVVSRDGQEIGRVQFDQDPDGGWLLGQATLCGGLGLPS